MKILVAGDTVPSSSNCSLFQSADLHTLIGDRLHGKVNEADFFVLNLESPLTDNEIPLPKCGPNLIASKDTVNGIKAMNPGLISLANNHIMDQGVEGYYSTLATLENAGISYVGVGDTMEAASKPYIFMKDDITVGIYACAEHEFSIVSDTNPGANPFDPLYSLDHIADLKQKCDYVIVLYHGGKEHYRYPSPNLQKMCRRMVDKGADLVVCQHSHCIGCKEEYKNATIVFGQGNFIFDRSESEFWKTSLLIEISLNMTNRAIRFIPIEKKGNKIAMARENSHTILNDFNIRSKEILDPGFVVSTYEQFAQGHISQYLTAMQGRMTKNIFFRAINLISKKKFGVWYTNKMYRSKEKLALRNYVECEAHRELFIAGLQ